jgi:hypothetical protein
VPQLQDNGSDYDYSAMPSSDVQQCSLLLKAIHQYFETNQDFTKYRMYRVLKSRVLARARRGGTLTTQETRDEAEYHAMEMEMDAFGQTWAQSVVICITSLTKTYQRIRPHEPRAELYERILHLVFKAFRGRTVEAMGPTKAKQFLTFLVDGTGDINGTAFETVFQSVLQIMLMDFAPIDITVLAPAVQALCIPPALNPTEFEHRHVQTLTYLLCMLHGIDVQMNGNAGTNLWIYHRNELWRCMTI